MVNTSVKTVHNYPDYIPPLESGDRLTRPEFERRYSAMSSIPNSRT
ncbi:MAG: hypothetical protein ACKO2Z_25455 [Sphaerospermopsis kisseleviana]